MRDLLVILAVVLLLCGTQKLRSIGAELGAAVRGFRKALAEGPAEQRSGPVRSDRPDAEFPEAAPPPRTDRDRA